MLQGGTGRLRLISYRGLSGIELSYWTLRVRNSAHYPISLGDLCITCMYSKRNHVKKDEHINCYSSTFFYCLHE